MSNASETKGRPLTLPERVMHQDGRVPIAIVLPVEIQGRLFEERLHAALAGLQAKHLLLRCLIEYKDGRPWFEVQDAPPPIPLRILARRNADDWVRECGNEEARLFDAGAPLVRLTWLRGEEASELLLTCHHCLCDGASVVTLLRELLLLHDAPEHDIGRDDSLHSYAELLPDAVLQDRGLQRRIRWLAALLRLVIRLFPAGRALTYSSRYTLRWTLDQSRLQALNQRCDAEGISVFGALSVAFILGFRGVCGARGVKKFTVPVDARKFLPKLQADHLFLIAPTIDVTLETPKKADDVTETGFWQLGRALKADMWQKIGRLGAKFYRHLLGMEYLHAVYARMIALAASRPAACNVSLSYLGRLDLAQERRDFRIVAVHSPSAALTPAPLIIISRFAGSLDFSFIADEQCLPRAQAIAIRDMAMKILRDSAQLPADTESRAEPATAAPSLPMPMEATA